MKEVTFHPHGEESEDSDGLPLVSVRAKYIGWISMPPAHPFFQGNVGVLATIIWAFSCVSFYLHVLLPLTPPSPARMLTVSLIFSWSLLSALLFVVTCLYRPSAVFLSPSGPSDGEATGG